MLKIGVDVGSTTLKCVVLDENNKIIYKEYNRHYSMIVEKTAELLERVRAMFPNDGRMGLAVSGSAGMGMAERAGLAFVQEVYATRIAVKRAVPKADTVIELGGEDAKILFLQGGLEVRMNGSCAGGTGAFIDQMATLLAVTPSDMKNIHHSLPLRSFRQERRSAPAQSGGEKGGYFRQYFRGRGESDHRRTGSRPGDRGHGGVPRRPSDIYGAASGGFRPPARA